MTVGLSHTRIEAPVKVTGAAKYAADHHPVAMLHATTVGALSRTGASSRSTRHARPGCPAWCASSWRPTCRVSSVSIPPPC